MKFAPLLIALLIGPTICQAEEPSQLAQLQKENSPNQTEEALNDLAFYAFSLAGTPYKYGGSSPETGFDCSGFVGYVFRQTLGINLPRSSHEINTLGEHIEADQLRPGDLVFYNTMRRSFSHVGIYLGDHQFIHSPSSGGGIRVEKTDERYWMKRYNGARRITSVR